MKKGFTKFFTILTALLFLGIGNVWGADEVKLASVGNEAVSTIGGTGTAPDFFDNKTYPSGDNSYSVTINTTFSTALGSEYKPDGSTKYKDYYYNANAACDMSAAPNNYIQVSATGCKITKIVVRALCSNSTIQPFPAIGFADGLPETTTIGSNAGRRADVIISDQSGSYGNKKRFDQASTVTYTFSTKVSEVYFSKQFKKVADQEATAWSTIPSSSQTYCIYGMDVYVEKNAPITAPAITAPTTDQSATYTVGDVISALSITATGNPTPTYQWYYNSSASTSGATSLGTSAQTASYTPANNVASDLYYYCVATNSAGSATSPYFHVTVNTPSAPTHSISYANLRGSDVSAYPTEFYEGVGVASFADLADVGDWHFAGWSPASIGTDVTTDQTITAQWTKTCETVLYSWESPAGTPIEVGGTAITKDKDGNTVDGNTNVNATLTNVTVDYKAIMLNGKIKSGAWDGNYVQITTDEAVKTGDKVKVTACTTKGNTSKKSSAQMRSGTSATSTAIFTDGGGTYNDILADGTLNPNTKTFTIPDGINTSTVTMTRSESSTNCWVTKLQIIREKEVAEENICTITFNSDGGSSVADILVEKGTKATRPADPTKSGATFAGWYNGADLFDWDVNVTGDVDLTAHWNVSHTVTYKDGTTTLGTETVIDGNSPVEYATYQTKEHYTFNGWFNNSDLDPSHAVTIASEEITADATYFGKWTENAKVTVTFRVDGGDYSSSEVYVGEKATSPDSPSKAGNVFQGWYNGADKFDFTAAIASGDAITLDAKWAAADPNHYVYAYNDDFHFDGVVYKSPEGKVDNGNGTSNKTLTTPYTLFSGDEGITSIVVTDGIYDSKTGAAQAVTALLKLNTTATSNLTITIKSDYTAVMKVKMGSWDVSDKAPTVTFKKGEDEISYTGTMSGKASDQSYAELTYNLEAGTYVMTTATKTLYFSNIDIVATPAVVPPTPETVRTGLEVGRYYTICLPKKVVAATGATFWSMSERNTDTENPLAYIVEENLPLTAGQPFLFQATATTLEVTYEGEAAAAGSHGALHGTLDAMDQDALDAAAGANTLYILKNNELRLASGRTGNSLAANRAYIIYEELDPVSTPAHAPGRQVRSMPLHKDVATGLDDLNADTQAQKVILNGQLFIIRGEKMYDATGILVK